MRIFLTGASGLVGAAFARAAARRGHAVTGIVDRFAGELSGPAARRSLDLGHEASVTSSLLEIFPDAMVNYAAASEPAAVDQDPAGSQAVNVALPATLARAAHHLSARLIHVSSEQAFDDTQSSPYKVTDLPAPVNLYGRQKVASERIVRALVPNFSAVVRAPLLMATVPDVAAARTNVCSKIGPPASPPGYSPTSIASLAPPKIWPRCCSSSVNARVFAAPYIGPARSGFPVTRWGWPFEPISNCRPNGPPFPPSVAPTSPRHPATAKPVSCSISLRSSASSKPAPKPLRNNSPSCRFPPPAGNGI